MRAPLQMSSLTSLGRLGLLAFLLAAAGGCPSGAPDKTSNTATTTTPEPTLQSKPTSSKAEEMVNNTLPKDKDEPTVAELLRKYQGVEKSPAGDKENKIRDVHFDSPLSDDEVKALMPHLAKLPELHTLYFRTDKLTDAALLDMAAVKQLKILSLGQGQGKGITDEGLKALAALKELVSLDLSDTNVKGPGLKHLAGLSSLEVLTLQFTPIADEACKDIAGFDQLRILDLSGTAVTGNGIKELARLPKLTHLLLSHTGLQDTDLKHVGKLKTLEHLFLSSTKVTDAGLAELVGITGLQELHLGKTAVTDEGVGKLQKALPKLKIVR